jgi:putative colanic acid biosynthesis UDP-glucose lipid carrier transferase
MAKAFKDDRDIPILELLLCLGDMAVVSMGFLCLHRAYGDISFRHYNHIQYIFGYPVPFLHIDAALLAAALFMITGVFFGLYSIRNRLSRDGQFGRIMTVWIVVLSLFLLFAYITKTSSVFSRVAVVAWMLMVPFLLNLERHIIYAVHHFLTREHGNVPVALVGCGESAQYFLEQLRLEKSLGIEVQGIYLPTGSESIVCENALVKGDIKQMVLDVQGNRYREVYIAMPTQSEMDIAYVFEELSDCSVPVYFVPDRITANLMSSRMFHLRGMPVIGVYDAMDRPEILLKRIEDIVISGIILCLMALPMLAIAILVKLGSKGPVFFRQWRYGLGGEPIEVWKFRSMTVCDDGDVIVQATKNDSRVTKVGAFLRRTSLDELPQFLNVLRGDMSIVGPRPHAISHNELYRKKIMGYMLRHLVKPGITGWAQVNGWRGETDTLEKMEKRVQYDLEYIKNWSLWFDLKIIALTALKGLSGKNAY